MAPLDLARRVETGMLMHPGDPSVAAEPHADFETDNYRVSWLELGTHADTHVDAPAHTEPNGVTLDDFLANDFRFTTCAIDCQDVRPRGRADPDATPERLEPCVDLLVFRTGWEDERGTECMAGHPALEPETARACAGRGLSISIDMLSSDPTGGGGVPTHHATLGVGLLVVENLCGSDVLPTDRMLDLYVMPLRVDADGALTRIAADTETGLIQ